MNPRTFELDYYDWLYWHELITIIKLWQGWNVIIWSWATLVSATLTESVNEMLSAWMTLHLPHG